MYSYCCLLPSVRDHMFLIIYPVTQYPSCFSSLDINDIHTLAHDYSASVCLQNASEIGLMSSTITADGFLSSLLQTIHIYT